MENVTGLQEPTENVDYAGGGGDSAPVGRFVNFGRYFSLNQDKAKGMAQNVGGKVEAGGQAARGAIDSASNAFNKAVRQGSLAYNHIAPPPQTVDVTPYGPAVMSAESPPPAPAPPQKKSPTSKHPDTYGMPKKASNIDEARGFADFKYGGPNSLEEQAGYDDIQKQVSDAQRKADALGSDTGLQSLLGEEYGALGGYDTPMGGAATGKSRLDAALTGTAGRPLFGEIGKRFGGNALQGYLNMAKYSASDAAKAAAASSADAAGKYGKDVADYDAAQKAYENANKPIVIPAAPGAGNSSEIGWQGERNGPSFENLFNSGFKSWNETEQSARERESKGTHLEAWKQLGYNGKSAGSVWLSKQFGVDNAVAQQVLDAMTEEDMDAWREANRKGPDSLNRWWQAMLAKYGKS